VARSSEKKKAPGRKRGIGPGVPGVDELVAELGGVLSPPVPAQDDVVSQVILPLQKVDPVVVIAPEDDRGIEELGARAGSE
jgi:hypothetical protein